MNAWRYLLASILAACVTLGARPSYAESLQFEGRGFRWPPIADGQRTVITYAKVSNRYQVSPTGHIVSPENCGAMHAFADIISLSPGVDSPTLDHELQSAFTAWEKAANITFVAVDDPLQANIVIGASDVANGRAFANLAYRNTAVMPHVAMALGIAEHHVDRVEPNGTMAEIDQAYICLNPTVRWKIAFDGNIEVYDLQYTFMHEIGHAIGLDHPGSSGAVMGYRYDEAVRELQPSDIVAVQQLYGPRAAH